MYAYLHRFPLKASAVSLGLALMLGVSAQEATQGGVAAVAPEAAELAPLAATQLLTNLTRAGDQLVAVGARGHIVISSDGVNWTQVPVPVNSLLTAVTFTDSGNGWADGHDAVILHSADGGRSWALQNFQPELSQPLLDVLFLDDRRGFAVGAYGLFLRTEDGGAHWVALEGEVMDEQLHFNAITRLGDGSLLVVGEEGMMALSGDQGVSWQRLQAPMESSQFAVLAEGERGVLVAGLRGNVYRTPDLNAGVWSKVETDSVQSVFGLAALADGRVAMAGLNASLLILDPQSAVHPLSIQYPVVASRASPNAPPLVRNAGPAHEPEQGAYSGVMAWKDQLLVVGDSGAKLLPLEP